MQPFAVAVVDVFGVPQVHSLKENGSDIVVTNDTRQVQRGIIRQNINHSVIFCTVGWVTWCGKMVRSWLANRTGSTLPSFLLIR